ncbi:TIR domain-containing protein [Streptacidiphilus sp. PB12-B1b]|uniref:TIR-like protein FxsC n=1 Tax=Streptacidiphilus sp. PB12-B1b TaxID=2705012 RepID=UPI0015FDDF27|nr:TIR-like protein FxsC [Streptacidiphilus sp. PB12-B1b]QMU74968.1 TIR domain-containing protein [Streptacidiphilus sp. PB12-B1b]
MTDPGRLGENARPYFFLSYAHTPGTGSSGHDPNLWVHRLYDDLCEAIMEITPHPEGVPVGFMDRGMHLGEGWVGRLSEALARCRVFVPLYSPRYFRSEPCGQEWRGFATRRVVSRYGGDHHTGIVPVWWVRVPRENLPSVASSLQFNHSDFGTDYLNEGMLALSKLGYFRQSYELAVHRLAHRIVQVAESVYIEPGTTDDFLTLQSAFEPPEPARQLRISVLACDVRKLPPGRAAHAYGSSALDWQPYRRESDLSLVRHAQGVVSKLNFHTSVHLFEDEAEKLLGPPGEPGADGAAGTAADGEDGADAGGDAGGGEEPSAPGVLLLDRWALLDPARQALVKRFDERNPSWISILEPWAEDDPDCRAAGPDLGGLADETLSRSRGELRPTFRGVQDGLPTLSAFDRELPVAAFRAMSGFVDRTRPQPPAEEASRPRPNLREALTGGTAKGDRPPRGPTGHEQQDTWNGSAHPGSGEADPAEGT